MTVQEIFNAFSHLKILVIGDVMVDEYVWGQAERISPEAPVPILRVERQEVRLGGAANVALNLKSLGAYPILCGYIGKDYYGKLFTQTLFKQGLGNEGILEVENRKTTVKTRVIAHTQQLLRIDAEQTDDVDETIQSSFLENIESLIPKCDALIFEDYDKGVLNKRVIQSIVKMAKKQGKPTIVDPKLRNFASYQQVTLFKPNLKELREGLNLKVNPKETQSLQEGLRKVLTTLTCENAMITLSEQGVVIGNEKEFYHIPAHIRKIADVSGAGDTVVSVAALGMALRLPLNIVAELANLAGGLVCEEVGVIPIARQKLQEEFSKLNLV